ncbi:MAG: hypothetical protein M3N93_01615 [Acidobacteriota bacterium]|nr:hypothetical protein [Acidobacteriota bacterium]
MIERVPANAGGVPLGYLVEHATLRVTGYSVTLARLPSALFGAGSVYLVALLTAELAFGDSWLPATILFAAFPLTIRYATESRVYSQALFLSVLATWLYVRLAREPGLLKTMLYALTLTLAIYTQPFAVSVAVAHIVWSMTARQPMQAARGAIAACFSVVAFLPWYLWSREMWAASVAGQQVGSPFSVKTPLMIFREFVGAGYWGSGLLLILAIMALRKYRSHRARALLALLIILPVILALIADGIFGYFIAARQFLWTLPAIAILAGSAMVETRGAPWRRVVVTVLATALCAMLVWQNVRYFTSGTENWDSAARQLVEAKRKGACIEVIPAGAIDYYRFFQPELQMGNCTSGNVLVVAVSPYARKDERRIDLGRLEASGYKQGNVAVVGKSAIMYFSR